LKEVNGKKKNRKNLEKTMPSKQSKMDSYWLGKPVINNFEKLEKELDDINVNARIERTDKHLFFLKSITFPLSLLITTKNQY
jgi:hypothetical protein